MLSTRSAAPVTPARAGVVASAAGLAAVPAAIDSDVAVLLLADMAPGARLWGFSRLVRGPGALRAVPGLRFAKVLGSGHEGRFGLRPSASVHGLFAVFAGEAVAAHFVDHSSVVAGYRAHAASFASLLLRAWSSRGRWGGQPIGIGAAAPAGPGPVAALTRASIHPLRALDFWRHAPAAQRSLEAASGCRLAVGLGEAPLLRQATFSIWDDVAAMDAYARTGAHLEAIRASARGGHFSESMFVRFEVLRADGAWQGKAIG